MSGFKVIQGKDSCPEHGAYDYTAYASGGKIVGRACPSCVQRNQRALHEKTIVARAARESERLADSVASSGIPKIFLGSTFDNYVPATSRAKRNLEIIQSYAGNFKTVLATKPATGLLLHGLTGTGKTHLGCALIQALIMSGYTARFASVPVLLQQMREAGRGELGQSGSSLMASLASVELLVLDEFGTHTKNDYDYQLLFQLVDARYQRNLPTVTITNADVKDLEVELDQRFLERLLGTSAPKLAFDWASARGKKAGQAQ